MTWEGAAAYVLVGATAYRMLHGWPEHRVKKDDTVLIWGGAGGLGSMAIQIAKAAGAVPVAVVSSTDKFDYCKALGAKGCINRNDFDHWGMLPHWKDNAGYAKWLKGVRAFGAALWDVLGEKKSPQLVFEHPGETTMPTSVFVCETGGAVVICAGTSGYNATVDLRYLWMRQKRVQGSHFANDDQAYAMNKLALAGKLDPCLSRGFTFAELPVAHQLMYENKHPHGNMSVLVGAKDFGLGISAAAPVAMDHIPLPKGDSHGGGAHHPYPLSVPVDAGQPLEAAIPVVADDGTVVKDLMHKGIVSCGLDDKVAYVADLMIKNDVHAVVVLEGDQAVGVVSQTDMVLARQGRSPAEARGLTARAVMTPGCVTCDAGMKLSEAITKMTSLRIHRLVVTEAKGGRNVPVGVISMTDVIRRMIVDA
jgi:crotonyl-CoA carboxylase/reductase